MQTKICSKCGIEKPLGEFHKHKNTKDGLQCICKTCKKEFNTKWYIENPEKTKENDLKWKTKNPEKKIKTQKKWKVKNLEKYREGQAKWYREVRRGGSDSPLDELPLQVYWNAYTSDIYPTIYKIGTGINADMRNRYNQPLNEFRTHNNIITVSYPVRSDGFVVESWFKHAFKHHRYNGIKFLKNGNTELFNINLISHYNISLVVENIFYYISDSTIRTPLKRDAEYMRNVINNHRYNLPNISESILEEFLNA